LSQVSFAVRVKWQIAGDKSGIFVALGNLSPRRPGETPYGVKRFSFLTLVSLSFPGTHSCEPASTASGTHNWSSALGDSGLYQVYLPYTGFSGVRGRDAVDVVLDEVTYPGSISRLYGIRFNGGGR